jgi:hypothetical protein
MISSDESEGEPQARTKTSTATSTLGNPTAVDSDGLLMDVDVQGLDDVPVTREDKRRDVDNFFHPAISKVINGKTKRYCLCKLCP